MIFPQKAKDGGVKPPLQFVMLKSACNVSGRDS